MAHPIMLHPIARACENSKRDIREICELMRPMSIMIEIGSYAGESMELFVRSGKIAEFHAVDSWCVDLSKTVASWNFPWERIEGSFDERKVSLEKEFPVKIFKNKITSQEAQSLFVDEFADLIYIDSDHTYDGVCNDIRWWWPKVKMEGILSGHDYEPKNEPAISVAVKDLLAGPDKLTTGPASWIKYRHTKELPGGKN